VFVSSYSAWTQSYAPERTSAIAYMNMPGDFKVKGDSVIIVIGCFKLVEEELICVGGGTLNNLESVVIPLYLTDGGEAGLHTSDTLIILAYSPKNGCNLILTPTYEPGKAYQSLSVGDTAVISQIDNSLGVFEYDVIEYRYCDQNSLDTVRPTVSLPAILDWSVNSTSLVGGQGEFISSQQNPGIHKVYISTTNLSQYCWSTDSIESITIVSDTIFRSTENVVEIESVDCSESGLIYLKDDAKSSENLFINDRPYSVEVFENGLTIDAGIYEFSGRDSLGCFFYTDQVEVIASGDCDDAIYIFVNKTPNSFRFEEEGLILIKNRAGQVKHELNGPLEWDGNTPSGYLSTGLYFVEFEDGSIRKLKYYK